jgi:hypothetical protein
LNADELLANFYTDTDTHDSEMRTREFYKYSSSRGVNTVIAAAINGVLLTNTPNGPDEWMTYLT